MSTVIAQPAADVVVAGLGQTGGVIAAELSIAGYRVVGIDKGPYLDYAIDFENTRKFDEWKTQFTHFFDHKLSMWTYTLRNDPRQFANPIRRYTKNGQTIPEGHEVGGMGVHFAANIGRYMPWTYQAYSGTMSRYGGSFLTNIEPNIDLEDYPVTYDELVPYYHAWERAIGVSGRDQEPFIPDSTYPNPPHPDTPLGVLFRDTTEAMGYNPYPHVSAIASQPYMNQYGVPRNQCIYDGWCGVGACNFVCETGAKGSSHVSTIPAAIKSGNFTMVTNSVVFRVDVDSTGRATGVRYYDHAGNINVQPAKVVYIGLWSQPSIRLMSLSGVGTPYNYAAQRGSLGRGFVPSPTSSSSANGTITSIGGNAYPAGNASGGGYDMLDYAGDSFDHTGLNFIGGARVMNNGGVYLGGTINTLTLVRPGPTNFGSAYKATLKDVLLPTSQGVSLGGAGVNLPTTDHFADLDPHYTDMFGDPLLRATFDFDQNCLNASDYLAPLMVPILTKMGAQSISVSKTAHGSVAHKDSWSAHQRGGARMGTNPQTSVTNAWMQSWSSENVFSAGEHSMMLGDCVTEGTHGIGPLAYLAADGIKKYLTSPGPLV